MAGTGIWKVNLLMFSEKNLKSFRIFAVLEGWHSEVANRG